MAGEGRSPAGAIISTARFSPEAERRDARYKTRSPSSHKTWRLSSPALNREEGTISRTPSSPPPANFAEEATQPSTGAPFSDPRQGLADLHLCIADSAASKLRGAPSHAG